MSWYCNFKQVDKSYVSLYNFDEALPTVWYICCDNLNSYDRINNICHRFARQPSAVFGFRWQSFLYNVNFYKLFYAYAANVDKFHEH